MKKLAILIILGITFLILGIICSNTRYGEKISYTEKKMKNCKNNSDCSIPLIEYKNINIKINDKAIKKIVTKINKKTNELYKKSKNSDLNAPECITKKDLFKYRMIYQNIFDTYENSEFFSIALKRNAIDVCYDKIVSENVEVYYYDKKKKKFLTQDDILKKLSVKSIDIEKKIAINVFKINEKENKDYKYYKTKNNGKLSFKVYFDYTGVLYVYYKQYEDNTYYNVDLGYSIWKNNNNKQY